MKREVSTKSAPSPVGPYSQAIDAGTVYCSGQLGTDPSTGNLEEGVAAQTARAISNIEQVLMAAGLGLANVVKTSVFLADLAEFPQMNTEYSKRFSPPFPARTTVGASALPRGARVEIDAVAVR